jgi:hypothetical protein
MRTIWRLILFAGVDDDVVANLRAERECWSKNDEDKDKE